MTAPPQVVIVGSWDVARTPGRTGLTLCQWNPDSGTLAVTDRGFPDISVGAFCLHPSLPILYCTDERATLPGYFRGGGGLVYALALRSDSGLLREINCTPSFGSLPSGVAVDAQGDYLIVTHHTGRDPVTRIAGTHQGDYRITLDYDDSTTVLFPLLRDGSIGPPCDVYRHQGTGGPLPRQTHAQLHSVTRSPTGGLFMVCDKGNDRLVVFTIDREAQRLRPCGAGYGAPPGSSPRYLAFHPVEPFVFLNHETQAIVTSLRYEQDGTLLPICTVSALPDDLPDGPEVKQSDLKVHPSGRFLYTLVRGLDLVSVFRVAGDGTLLRIQTLAIQGSSPRACALSPDGRFLLVAGLTSDEVSVWSIADDGTLSPTAGGVVCQHPGALVFVTSGGPERVALP